MNVVQLVERVPHEGKWAWLSKRANNMLSRGRLLVFANSIGDAEELAQNFGDFLGKEAGSVHEGLDAPECLRIVSAFQQGKFDVLVATDNAWLRLDKSSKLTVVSYDSPRDIMTHMNRVGFASGAGGAGEAYTLLHDGDHGMAALLVEHFEQIKHPVSAGLKAVAARPLAPEQGKLVPEASDSDEDLFAPGFRLQSGLQLRLHSQVPPPGLRPPLQVSQSGLQLRLPFKGPPQVPPPGLRPPFPTVALQSHEPGLQPPFAVQPSATTRQPHILGQRPPTALQQPDAVQSSVATMQFHPTVALQSHEFGLRPPTAMPQSSAATMQFHPTVSVQSHILGLRPPTAMPQSDGLLGLRGLFAGQPGMGQQTSLPTEGVRGSVQMPAAEMQTTVSVALEIAARLRLNSSSQLTPGVACDVPRDTTVSAAVEIAARLRLDSSSQLTAGVACDIPHGIISSVQPHGGGAAAPGTFAATTASSLPPGSNGRTTSNDTMPSPAPSPTRPDVPVPARGDGPAVLQLSMSDSAQKPAADNWSRFKEDEKYKAAADTNVNHKHVGESLRTLTLEDRLEIRRKSRALAKRGATAGGEIDDDSGEETLETTPRVSKDPSSDTSKPKTRVSKDRTKRSVQEIDDDEDDVLVDVSGAKSSSGRLEKGPPGNVDLTTSGGARAMEGAAARGARCPSSNKKSLEVLDVAASAPVANGRGSKVAVAQVEDLDVVTELDVDDTSDKAAAARRAQRKRRKVDVEDSVIIL